MPDDARGPHRYPRLTGGAPAQNAFVESFNGKFRDECLNEHHFLSLAEARRLIAAWRHDYNTARPHSALHNLTPNELPNRHGFHPAAERRSQPTGKKMGLSSPSPKSLDSHNS